jgi:hypothetical protein
VAIRNGSDQELLGVRLVSIRAMMRSWQIEGLTAQRQVQ